MKSAPQARVWERWEGRHSRVDSLQKGTAMHPGVLHVVIVHLPIGITIAAIAADALWALTKRPLFKSAGMYCLTAALIVAIPTVILGEFRADEMKATGDLANLIDDHEAAGVTTMCLLAGATVVRFVTHKWPRKWMFAVYAIIMVAALVAITIAGELGGEIVYGKGFLKELFM